MQSALIIFSMLESLYEILNMPRHLSFDLQENTYGAPSKESPLFINASDLTVI